MLTVDQCNHVEVPLDIESKELSLHKSHLDTIGRTTIKLTAKNVIDEHKRSDVYVSGI